MSESWSKHPRVDVSKGVARFSYNIVHKSRAFGSALTQSLVDSIPLCLVDNTSESDTRPP